MAEGTSENRSWWWWAVMTELSLVPIAYLAGWLSGSPPCWHPGGEDSPSRALLGCLAGGAAVVPLLVGYFALDKSRWEPIVQIKQLVAELARRLCGDCTVAEVALLALVAGFSEELAFRGWLQNWLAHVAGNTTFGTAWALIAAGLVFGLFHAVSPLYFLLASLVGIYLGLVYLLTGTLEAAVVAHGLYDFFALLRLRAAPVSDARQ